MVVFCSAFLALLHLLVQFGEDLFGLDVLVEVEDVAAQLDHHFDLLDEDLVQLLDVGLDVGAGLVDVLEDGHFLLDDLDALLAARIVLEDQLLFLFQDLLNHFLMILRQSLDISLVLDRQLVKGRHAVTQLLSLRLPFGRVLLLRLVSVLPTLE